MADRDQRMQDLFAAGIGVGSASASAGDGWEPPTPAELAGVFPKLEVLELLGRGGMGAVYKARQPHLDRLVALKLLSPRLGADPAFAERFRREALALARLSHPQIVALHDVGEAGEWRYLLMEYVDGATLRHALATGAFSPAAALALAPQLCDALAYAHAQGVVHRDLKPENILLDAQGRAHIADFGLAKLAHPGPAPVSSITRTGERIGTAAYMAPEQIEGSREVDHRADLYALGVVLYEMLTGNLPLGRFEPPSRRVRVDVRVDEVVLRALERVPEQRWQSAEEVRRAVAAAMAERRGRRTVGLVTAALLCVLAGLIGAVVMRYAPSSPAAMPAVAPPEVMALPQHVAPPEPAAVAAQAPAPQVEAPAAPAPPAVPAGSTPPAAPAPPTAPIAVEAIPPAAPPDGRDLVVTGSGELILEIEAGAHDLSDLSSRGIPGLVATAGDDGIAPIPGGIVSGEPTTEYEKAKRRVIARLNSLVLHLDVRAAPVRLAVPPDLVHFLRYHGKGTLRLRGLRGEKLVVTTTGSGSLIATDLAIGRLEVMQRGDGPDTLGGHAETLVVDVGGFSHTSSSITVNGSAVGFTETGSGLVDARSLAAPTIDASVTGSGQLKLGGHAKELRLRLLGSGSIDAPGLAVDHADVTITGSGSATLGDLQALDATCTGGGALHYSGNPKLGRIVTGN